MGEIVDGVLLEELAELVDDVIRIGVLVFTDVSLDVVMDVVVLSVIVVAILCVVVNVGVVEVTGLLVDFDGVVGMVNN